MRAATVLIALLLTVTAVAQHDQDMSPEKMQEMWAEYMKIAQPAEAHQHLEPMVGSWKVTVKVWMGGPGTEPTVSEGTAERTWVLGKRYVREELKTQMMGQPFEGLGYTGYDNYKNMYTTVWMDNMGTAMLTALGMRHPETGVFTFYGAMDEPMMSVQDRTVKTVHRLVGDDEDVFEMYDLHAGDDYKVMEITYTRK